MKLFKKALILLLLISLVTLSFFSKSLLNNTFVKIELKRMLFPAWKKSGTKCILYWMPMWNDKTFSFGSDKYEPFKDCIFNNCFATSDRSLMPTEDFDAIVFHAAQYNPSYLSPSIRKPHQRYIFATMESPVSMENMPLRLYGSFYNWTMTYRLDSDIIMPYGYVIKNTTNYTMPAPETINSKTHLVAWLVSHCYTHNRRELIYNNLSKFIDIDVYGQCGTLQCPTDVDDVKSSACYDYIEQKYKFYLSFENTNCKDYVTEKLYMLLTKNIVPIVYGLADYENFVPPNSVIIVNKFPTIKQLADYILYLDKKPEEYLKYFQWKKYYYIGVPINRPPCTLCKMLNDPLQPPKIYEDIYTWWWGENDEYCKSTRHNGENIVASLKLLQKQNSEATLTKYTATIEAVSGRNSVN